MFLDKLMQYRQYCESQYDATSRLLSMFRPRFDYAAKLSAINKLIIDHDRGNVTYTDRDLDILSAGKLSRLLGNHKEQLPDLLREALASRQEVSGISLR